VSARAVFTDFVNSGVFGGRWTLNRWPRSSMQSLALEWITVTLSWRVHQKTKLQRVLNSAARVITGTRKFDRGLGQILHWLDVPYRVLFKLAVTVHQCLNGRASPYLSEHCIPVSNADTRRHLRSANRHLLVVPRFRLNTYGRRAFSVAGPMAWNSSGIQRLAQTVLGV